MRLVSFLRPDGTASFGRLEGSSIVDLGGSAGGFLREALNDEALLAGDGDRRDTDSVTLLPVIPDPAKILCIGLNYATHVKETGREQKEHPAVFTRWADTLVAHGQPLVRPQVSERFDYEGEVAIVIGKAGHKIAHANAIGHIAGYSLFNDASVRDWQRHNIQFTPGKNFPGTGGFGPALVTPDEISDLASVRVQTRLNGELLQDQPISDLIWDIPFLIEYCSAFTPLAPGDVIVTGTPGGVGDKRNPPIYMKNGDRVTVTAEPIGELANPVTDE